VRYHEFTDEIASDLTSDGDASARLMSGLSGLVTSRLWEHAALTISTAVPRSTPTLLLICIRFNPRWLESERDLDLTRDRTEVRVPKTADAVVKVTARRHVRIESRVLRPGVQIAADQRDARALRTAKPDLRDPRRRQVVGHRELAELDVRTVLHEVLVGVEAV